MTNQMASSGRGDALASMRLDISDVLHKLNQVSTMMQKTMSQVQQKSMQTTQSMTKDTKAFMHVSRGAAKTFSLDWWKRFGEVAVGFTVAYRAMNAIQAAMVRTLQTFQEGLVAIDEFRMGVVSIAASLQMLTEAPSKKSLEAYMRFGEVMFKKMEILAIRHFATGQQLQMAFTKMVTLGIVPQTEQQLESMAALVDRILMATKGLDAGRQIMTEIQAVIEGMQRPGAVVARELKSLVPHYKELIATMQREPNIAKRTQMFLEGIAAPLAAVGSVSGEIMKTHQAWLASLGTAATIMLRSGLHKMYDDLLDIMKSMVGYLIGKNGLTEKGIELAYIYHASWEIVLGAMIKVKDTAVVIGALYKVLTFDIPIISGFFWTLRSGVITLKFGLKEVVMIIEELKRGLSLATKEGKTFDDYLDEVYKKMGDVKPALRFPMHLKAMYLALQNMLDDISESNRARLKDMADEGEGLFDRIDRRSAILFAEMSDEIMRMKGPADWLDPEKFEKFAAIIRAQSKDLIKDILEYIQKLMKGSDEEIEKERRARLRRERQVLSLQKQMHKDILVFRLEKLKQSAEDELDLRLKKIEELNLAEEAANKLRSDAYDAYMEKTRIIHGNFMQGMTRGIHTYVNSLKTEFAMGVFYAEEAARSMQSAFSELFFDVMMDEFKSWEDYVRSLLRGLSRMLSELLSQMLMIRALKAFDIEPSMNFGKMFAGIAIGAAFYGGGVGSFEGTSYGAAMESGFTGTAGTGSYSSVDPTLAPSWHEGKIPLSVLPRFHNGLFPGEIPAIIRKDESVLTPKQMKSLLSDKGMTYNVFINALDAASFMELTRRTPQAIIRPFVEAVAGNDPALKGAIKLGAS